MGKTNHKKIYWASPDIREEDAQAVQEAVRSGWVGGSGPILKEFEGEFANKVNAKYAIGVNNGTSGLLAGCMALMPEHDSLKIAVPSLTFIASVNAPFLFTRDIQFLDNDVKTFTVDVNNVKKDRNVIIPVDVGGVPCDYNRIKELRIPILEDAAEALGSEYKTLKIGSVSDITIFSLHAAKIITSGEGGMITTNSDELYEKLSSIVNQGFVKNKQRWDYKHDKLGFNFRMTEMQAALGRSQLKRLEEYLWHRLSLYNIYHDILYDKVEYQECPIDCKNSHFLFPILVPVKKQSLMVRRLWEMDGIETKITWKPVHLQEPFYYSHGQISLPNAEYVYRRVISLPISNGTSEEEVKLVAERVLYHLNKINKDGVIIP